MPFTRCRDWLKSGTTTGRVTIQKRIENWKYTRSPRKPKAGFLEPSILLIIHDAVTDNQPLAIFLR